MSGKLTLALEPGIDRFGKKFYVAKLSGPFLIDCSEKPDGSQGVAFLVFISEEGNEELQITHITHPKKNKEEKK